MELWDSFQNPTVASETIKVVFTHAHAVADQRRVRVYAEFRA